MVGWARTAMAARCSSEAWFEKKNFFYLSISGKLAVANCKKLFIFTLRNRGLLRLLLSKSRAEDLHVTAGEEEEGGNVMGVHFFPTTCEMDYISLWL